MQTFVITRNTLEATDYIRKNNVDTVYPIVRNWNLSSFPAFDRQTKSINPDWVIFEYVPYSFHKKGMPFNILLYVLLLRLRKQKVAVFFHEVAIRWSFKPKHLFLSVVQRIVSILLLALSNQAFTSMQHYRNLFPSFMRKKIHLIPVGSNIFCAAEAGENGAAPERQSAPETSFMLGCFGGDGAEKGYDILLKALKNVENSRLLFVGKGANIKTMSHELGIADRVTVTGEVDKRTALRLLRGCDVFAMVNADIRGGIGFKSGSLAAGFNAGLPVLGLKGVITETDFLVHRENCYLVNDPRVESFEKAIRELKDSPELVEKLKENSAKFYHAYLGWDKIALKHIESLSQ